MNSQLVLSSWFLLPRDPFSSPPLQFLCDRFIMFKMITWIFAGLFLLGISAWASIKVFGLSYEQPNYKVTASQGRIEIRDYPSMIVAQGEFTGERKDSINKGFMVVAGYIFGKNVSAQNVNMTVPVMQQSSEKISMTVPVMQQSSEKISMTVPVMQQSSEKISMTVPVMQQSSEKIPMTVPVMQQSSEKIPMTVPVMQSENPNNNWTLSFVMPAKYSLQTLPTPTNTNVKLKEIPAKRCAVIRFSGMWTENNLNKRTSELQKFITSQHLTAISTPIYAFFNPPWTPWFMRRNEIMIEISKN